MGVGPGLRQGVEWGHYWLIPSRPHNAYAAPPHTAAPHSAPTSVLGRESPRRRTMDPPCLTRVQPATRARATARHAAELPVRGHPPIRVLVLEDDLDTSEALSLVLSLDEGFAAAAVHEVATCLERIRVSTASPDGGQSHPLRRAARRHPATGRTPGHRGARDGYGRSEARPAASARLHSPLRQLSGDPCAGAGGKQHPSSAQTV
jgi:hypothetical protein